MTNWVRTVSALDSAIIQTIAGTRDGVVEITIERGGATVDCTVGVKDLHKLASPSVLLEVSGAVIHALTLQQARHYNVPIDGV